MKNKLIKLILAVFTVIMPAQGDIYACQPAGDILRPVAAAERPAGPVQNRTILDKKFKFSPDFKNRHNEIIRIMGEAARAFARLNVKWVAVKTTGHLSHTHNIPQIEMVDLRLPHDGYRSWSTGYKLSINELIYNIIDAIAIRWFEAGQPARYRGIIRVNIRRIGDDLLIEIDDNGIGFRHVELTKLFRAAKIQSKKKTAKYADLRLIGFAGQGVSKMYGRGLIAGLGGKIEIDTFRPDSGAHNLTYFSDSRIVINEGQRNTQGSTIRFTFPRIFNRKIGEMLPGGVLLQDSQVAVETERALLRPVALLDREDNNNNIDNIVDSILTKITRLIQKPYLTSGDLNSIIWALTENELPRRADGNFRLFTDEEIFEIIERVETHLMQVSFGADEQFRQVIREPLEQFRVVLIDKRRPLSLIIPSQDRLINNLAIFFQTAKISPDEFPIFLARDALAAGEFLHYYGYITGHQASFASVYQPGMSKTAIISDYLPDSTIDMVQKATDLAKTHAIERLQMAGIIPAKASDPFYDVFHPEIYENLERYFMEDIAIQWEKNPALFREAEILFKQMERNGITRHKNIVIMDMAVTGKTVLYVKTVLKYFCEKREIDIGVIRIFVGYTHDKKMCLPELRLFAPHFNASGRPFKDQVWPFYRTGRDDESGEVLFDIHKKRFDMLVHVYRSLRLYNAALCYVMEGGDFRSAPARPLESGEKRTNLADAQI